MKLAKTLVPFIVAIVIAFAAIGNSIPQIKSQPVELEIEIGESPVELVEAGKRIFMSDRAQCLTCHSLGEDPKARCPNQAGLGERAITRKPGMSAGEYIIESVYNPNAFVVPGYPKNQMTPVNKPPIALSHDEILAVVAYLNSLGGTTDEAFVEQARSSQAPWRKGLLIADASEDQAQLPILPGKKSDGSELFQKIGCIQCHQVGEEGETVGPELTAIGASQSGAYILESILDPYKVIVKGYKQIIVAWKDDGKQDLYGVPVEWIPSREEPRQVRLSVPADAITGTGDDFFGAEADEGEDFFGLEDNAPTEKEDDFFGLEEDEAAGESKVAGSERVELVVDLTQVAYIGDTVVAIETEDEFIRYIGDYVEGDEDKGIVLSLLEGGRWTEKRIPPDNVSYMTHPMSVMPEDFANTMTPQEIYNLLAYLLDQKGSQ